MASPILVLIRSEQPENMFASYTGESRRVRVEFADG